MVHDRDTCKKSVPEVHHKSMGRWQVIPFFNKVVYSVAWPALCKAVSQASVLLGTCFLDLLLKAPLIPAANLFGTELMYCCIPVKLA